MNRMNCKICQTPNERIKYKLRNAQVFVCKNCGFHYSNYLDPPQDENKIPDDSELTTEIQSYLSDQLQYNKKRFEKHASLVKKYLEGNLKSKILDVGCGGGLYLSLMNSADTECYGIEPELNRLNYAKKISGLENIVPHPIDSEYWLSNHLNSFDVITLWDVIEHVNDPTVIFSSANKLLKKNGLLFIDTPCRDTFFHKFGEWTHKLSFGRFPSFLNIMYSDHLFGHKQIFSRTDFKTFCEHHNLTILKLDLIHELSFPLSYYLRKMFIPNFLIPTISYALNIFIKLTPIRNKMLVIITK